MSADSPLRPLDAVKSEDLPALSLVASPSKRRQILELAAEAEARGFPAIACPTLGSALGLCASLAHVTSSVHFYTAIQGIYGNSVGEIGSLASHIHEVSGGRFALGLGVSHEPMVRRLGASMGPPLGDMRTFVESLRSNEKYGGELPPIYVAALRNRMLDLAADIGEGALWANASYSYATAQVSRVDETRRTSGFYLANMIPTVVGEDRAAAAAVNKRTMATYVRLPNYRNYWKAAGYVEEMEAIESAIAGGNTGDHGHLMSDRWLEDCTLFGTPEDIRNGFLRWRALGIEPIAVMSSTSGGQVKAIGELFDVYSR
jgi:alkanesulfonate monooxygenase SsuD/methylene tetrahydromethanopterin reductase-like flavin-dependent oxidoreductase (luciferase family)